VGYQTYFALSATALANDSEFDVDDGATKAKIKSAFVKSLKSKKMNKKVLGEFIELIA
jgi:predicted HAD superfamily hydrolase